MGQRDVRSWLAEQHNAIHLVTVSKLGLVIPSGYFCNGTLLVENVVILPLCDPALIADRPRRFRKHVEYMVVTLALEVLTNARLLEQVHRRERTKDNLRGANVTMC